MARIAVIGAGSIGRRHAENAIRLGAEVIHASWRDIAAHPGGAEAGLAALIARDWPQGAVIATATDLRASVIAPFARAGIPLYIEKPLAADPAEIDAISTLMAPVADRSMIGFMMRYHPAFAWLAGLDRSDIYRARFEIGHDVRQWRSNWRFADSYAARPEGGGVLLDLCHEIDMCLALFAGLGPVSVDCLGHDAFPGVDFATSVRLAPPGSHIGGSGPVVDIAMDYLSPVSLRRLEWRGLHQTIELDLATGGGRHWQDGAWHDIALPGDRNQMFVDAMADFLALADGGAPVSGAAMPPLFTPTLPIARTIAAAHAARRFTGTIKGAFA